MKLHLASDLHREIHEFQYPRQSAEFDAVVLAGDIGGFRKGSKKDHLDWARETWPDKLIIYVSGNHEFYWGELDHEMSRWSAEENDIHYLEKSTFEIDGVRFIGCTLWTDFNLLGTQEESMKFAAERISDFRLILNEDWRPISPENVLQEFMKSRQFLVEELAKPFDGDTVVVTHFGPAPNSVVSKLVDSQAAPYYVSDLSDLMGPATLWLHGHVHESVDYLVNGTRVVSNPRGYDSGTGPQNVRFDPDLILDTRRVENTE